MKPNYQNEACLAPHRRTIQLTKVHGDGRRGYRHGARAPLQVLTDVYRSTYRMFTLRASRTAAITNDVIACSIIISLAQRDSTGVSVGEKAVHVVKERNR